MTPELVIVGDEAWLPDEWERQQTKLARNRERERAYRRRPDVRAKQREYVQRWRAAHPGYTAEWNRRNRAGTQRRLVGSLHSLRCAGPTIATGCRCKKIRVYLGRTL